MLVFASPRDSVRAAATNDAVGANCREREGGRERKITFVEFLKKYQLTTEKVDPKVMHKMFFAK